jgi:hypothetical protein
VIAPCQTGETRALLPASQRGSTASTARLACASTKSRCQGVFSFLDGPAPIKSTASHLIRRDGVSYLKCPLGGCSERLCKIQDSLPASEAINNVIRERIASSITPRVLGREEISSSHTGLHKTLPLLVLRWVSRLPLMSMTA